MISGPFGIWVPNWSFFGPPGKQGDARELEKMLRAREEFDILAILAPAWLLSCWLSTLLLCCFVALLLCCYFAALLMILGAKISLFWWLRQHENIASV